MTLNTVYHLARADFLERIRGKGIIITVILTMYLSYLFVPPDSATYAAIVVSGKRLRYSSAGIGLMFGITISLFLSLFAFAQSRFELCGLTLYPRYSFTIIT